MQMTQFYTVQRTVYAAIRNLQCSFNALRVTLSKHKLVLNTKKTKFMLFSRSTNTDFNTVNITTLTGSNLERVTDYKYLGIWLDDKLTFKSHINKLVGKCRQQLGYLYRNKSCFPHVC